MEKTDYKKLMRRAEELRAAADRARGAADAAMVTLKKRHGVATLDEAEKLLAKLRIEAKSSAAAYARALARFEKKWGDVLRDDTNTNDI
jgi:hypothetical protein